MEGVKELKVSPICQRKHICVNGCEFMQVNRLMTRRTSPSMRVAASLARLSSWLGLP